MREVLVKNIMAVELSGRFAILLRDTIENRYMCIWVGLSEAEEIAIELDGLKVARPLSHDLLCSVIDNLNAHIDYIVIHDIKEDIFYSKILLNAAHGRIELDSRPGDAIAIALKTKAPIYVEDTVMNKVGIHGEKDENSLDGPSQPEVGSNEDLNKLSAFSDFVDSLDFDMEDFGDT